MADKPLTVRQRFLEAGMPNKLLEQHLADGRIRVDEVRITDLDMETLPGARVAIYPADAPDMP